MNGLPMGAAAPAPAGAPADDTTIDVEKMDIQGMLMEKLHIDETQFEQLIEMLQSAQTPEEAAQMIKSFDQNPETMHEPYEPAAPAQAAPAQAGLPIQQ